MIESTSVNGIDYVAETEKYVKERFEKLYNEEIKNNKKNLKESDVHYRFKAIAVDASNIKVELDYTNCYYIRCTDDRGILFINEVFPTDMPVDMWEKFKDDLKQKEPVKSLFDFLQIADWEDLTYIGNNISETVNPFVHILRDVIEWAAIIRTVLDEKDCIIFKDGLLRNKTFKYVKNDPNCAYVKLKEKLKHVCKERNNIVVGIAKSGKLLDMIRDLIRPYMNTDFTKPFTIVIPNNAKIMEMSYNYKLYREGEIVFGNNLYVTSFMLKPDIEKLCVVEIPEWEEERALDILETIYTIGIRRLPLHVSGLPLPVVHAHEKSKVIKVHSSLLANEIKNRIKK